jgi:hypothetical protein
MDAAPCSLRYECCDNVRIVIGRGLAQGWCFGAVAGEEQLRLNSSLRRGPAGHLV